MNQPMRRKERAVTGLAAIAAILDDIHVCHLGLADGEETYVVPVNFGYTLSKEGALTLYFHGAPAGRKYSLLIQNGKAGFEMDGRHALMVQEAKDNPCAYSFAYASGCPLTTPSGSMVGAYFMQDPEGHMFEVAVPHFSLDVPDARRTLN